MNSQIKINLNIKFFIILISFLISSCFGNESSKSNNDNQQYEWENLIKKLIGSGSSTEVESKLIQIVQVGNDENKDDIDPILEDISIKGIEEMSFMTPFQRKDMIMEFERNADFEELPNVIDNALRHWNVYVKDEDFSNGLKWQLSKTGGVVVDPSLKNKIDLKTRLIEIISKGFRNFIKTLKAVDNALLSQSNVSQIKTRKAPIGAKEEIEDFKTDLNLIGRLLKGIAKIYIEKRSEQDVEFAEKIRHMEQQFKQQLDRDKQRVK